MFCAGAGPAFDGRGGSRRYAAMRRCLPSARCGCSCAEPGPLRERSITSRRRNIPHIWMVLRRARPPRREANHDGMLRSGVQRRGRNITQVRMVLRWARPPRREANHGGMLRSGVPRGGVTHPRCGWCCAGPGPLGERQIKTACCDQGCRAEA